MVQPFNTVQAMEGCYGNKITRAISKLDKTIISSELAKLFLLYTYVLICSYNN